MTFYENFCRKKFSLNVINFLEKRFYTAFVHINKLILKVYKSMERRDNMFTIYAKPVAKKSNNFKLWLSADKYGASYGGGGGGIAYLN